VKIIQHSHEILTSLNGEEILKFIESIGRIAYRSQDKITEDSAFKFIKNLINREHLSVIEHFNVSVKMITCRSITHEIVRHRLASYTQSSTRYIDSDKDGCIFIIPHWINWYDKKIILDKSIFDFKESDHLMKFIDEYKLDEITTIWLSEMWDSEQDYRRLRELGVPPQNAREILPNSTETEICMTANLREWRHFFKLRTSPQAHPDMQLLTRPILKEFQSKIPIIFDDISVEESI
jgi:thymidylate synthase (FAD)